MIIVILVMMIIMVLGVTWDNLFTTLISKVVTVSITVRFTWCPFYVNVRLTELEVRAKEDF